MTNYTYSLVFEVTYLNEEGKIIEIGYEVVEVKVIPGSSLEGARITKERKKLESNYSGFHAINAFKKLFGKSYTETVIEFKSHCLIS